MHLRGLLILHSIWALIRDFTADIADEGDIVDAEEAEEVTKRDSFMSRVRLQKKLRSCLEHRLHRKQC